ncbi:MAG: hypothetical protein MUF84_09780 [Anaerolineae bacterium]|nr:hypothetical protein [Anaerolineae bacterium]
MWGDQVDIVFTNDAVINGQDRNLYVNYLTVGGTTQQAEGASVRLDRGTGEAAFDGEDVIVGQEVVLWNGALRVHTTAPQQRTADHGARVRDPGGRRVSADAATAEWTGAPNVDGDRE